MRSIQMFKMIGGKSIPLLPKSSPSKIFLFSQLQGTVLFQFRIDTNDASIVIPLRTIRSPLGKNLGIRPIPHKAIGIFLHEFGQLLFLTQLQQAERLPFQRIIRVRPTPARPEHTKRTVILFGIKINPSKGPGHSGTLGQVKATF